MKKRIIVLSSVCIGLGVAGCQLGVDQQQELMPTKAVVEQPYSKTLVTIGDSISEGWLPGNHYDEPYGQYASELLEMRFSQAACQSNMIVANKQHQNNDFATLVSQSKDKLKRASVIIIFEGTNDYGRHSSLKKAEVVLNREIKRIKSWNKTAYILGITPLNRWDKGNGKSGYDLKNKAGYTLNDLVKMEERVYKENHIPYTSFAKMGLSLQQCDFIDDLHPLPATQKKMGLALAQYLVKQMPITKQTKTLEVAKKAPVFTSLVFDYKVTILKPKTTVESDASVRDFNGHTYYRIVKNKKVIGYVDERAIKNKNVS